MIPEVRIHPESNPLGDYLHRAEDFYQVLLMVSFIPFLVYFMLSWRDHIEIAASCSSFTARTGWWPRAAWKALPPWCAPSWWVISAGPADGRDQLGDVLDDGSFVSTAGRAAERFSEFGA